MYKARKQSSPWKLPTIVLGRQVEKGFVIQTGQRCRDCRSNRKLHRKRRQISYIIERLCILKVSDPAGEFGFVQQQVLSRSLQRSRTLTMSYTRVSEHKRNGAEYSRRPSNRVPLLMPSQLDPRFEFSRVGNMRRYLRLHRAVGNTNSPQESQS